ncbi:MFS transporter [Rhodococcus sp. NPDC057529]|uniref:MFS transporter n=1 Tax=Rhodococcus sp. NPDC057529 TaxID=3346158 RepID=UPI0036707F70
MTLMSEIRDVETIDRRTRAKALVASGIGSTIEWYDFFLYGTMAALVFGPLFFPSDNPSAALMLSFASFALAFAMRPLGGIIFSHIGDRIGRKKTLVMTLSLMGGSTLAIGLLPDYTAIGIWAPILLTVLRLIQGLALGGEWGGGVLLAVEYAPKKYRGLFGAVPQAGTMLGLALGSVAASGATAIFSEEDFLRIGWRIPFILSFVLVLIAFWIRHTVDETPSFKKVLARENTNKVPLVETIKYHWRAVLVTIGAKFIETSVFYVFAVFSISYAIGLGFERTDTLNAVLSASLVAVPTVLFTAWISDRIGRKKTFVVGAVSSMAFVLPFFWLLNQGSVALLFVAVVVGFAVVYPMSGAVMGPLFAENFPPEVRYTGISLGYQLGTALVGGTLPLIATIMLATFNDSYIPIALFIVACGIVSLTAIAFAKEGRGRDLDT